MRYRVEWFSGLEVLREDMDQAQFGRMDVEGSLQTDFWRNGIIKDPNGLSNLTVTVDATTNTLINVGWGVGYANGKRIAIEADKTYDSSAPTATTNGVCTPQSSGNRGIPLASYVRGQSNFVWAEFLEVSRTNPTAVSLVDSSRHYHHHDTGYRIVINTTNAPGNNNGLTNAVFLGTVFGQGASTALVSAPNGICDITRSYLTLIPKDALSTDNYQDRSVTPQKIKFAGENFIFDGACFSTVVASSNITIPIQPLLPTSGASKRFAQRAGMGFASSKSAFRYNYDGFYRLINISVEGDNVGSLVPVYDGLCNITRMVETFDGYAVSHDITYRSQDGASLVASVQENGV